MTTTATAANATTVAIATAAATILCAPWQFRLFVFSSSSAHGHFSTIIYLDSPTPSEFFEVFPKSSAHRRIAGVVQR